MAGGEALPHYGVRLDPGSGELVSSEIAAFITDRALITVRKDGGIDIGALTNGGIGARTSPPRAASGS